MPASFVPIPVLIVSVILLLRAETREPRDKRQIKIWKPLATVCCIAIAALAFAMPLSVPLYTVLVLTGLTLSLIGDWLLIDADEEPRLFVAGLVAFLLAHIAYIFAFAYARSVRGGPYDLGRELIAAALLFVLGAVAYFYLRPSLGPYRQPVLAYMIVISLMVHQAVAGVSPNAGLLSQPALAVGGALLFYMSDLMLAINRFVFEGEGRYNNVWVLATYYGAQLLIALSASFVF
jgi:uncharacterized membrane protein YhhN